MKFSLAYAILLLSLFSCANYTSSTWDFGFVEYEGEVYVTEPYNNTLVVFLDVKSYNESIIADLGLAKFEIYWIRVASDIPKYKDVYPNITLGEMIGSTFHLYDRAIRIYFDAEKDTQISLVFWFNITYLDGTWTQTWRSLSINVTILEGVETHNIDFTFGFENIERNPINVALIVISIVEFGVIILLKKSFK
ncbi:MAG: hypothetical protein Q6351_004760 [Candidatus Njordarchaeum guaymaensis]